MNQIQHYFNATERLFAGILAFIWLVSSVYPVQLSWAGLAAAAVMAVLILLLYRYRKSVAQAIQQGVAHMRPMAILLIGAAIRILMVALHDNEHNADGGDFERIALEMLQGQYLMTPGRPPAPSWQTTAMYGLFGMHRSWPLLPQLMWDILHLWLVYRLGKYFFDENMGKTAALLLALHPDHILNATEINTENGYFLLFYIGILLLTAAKKGHFNALLAGLCWGAAHYFRTTTPLALMAWVLMTIFDRSGVFRRNTLGLFAGFLIAIAPLIAYNKTTYGIWSATSYQMGGWSVFLSTNPQYLGNWNRADVDYFEQCAAAVSIPVGTHPAVFRDKLALTMAWERGQQYPWHWLFSAVAFKPYCLWGDNGGGIWTQRRFAHYPVVRYGLQAYFILYHKWLCLLAAVGLWRLSHRADPLSPYLRFFLWFALLTTAAHSFLEVRAMYHHIFFGFMAWVAAYGIAYGYQRSPTFSASREG
jgi:4-amino-4-deoxy-L-arabinose transferase-like glycosyltransferase